MKRFQVVNFTRIFGYSWIFLGHLALVYLIFQAEWKLLLLSLFIHYIVSQIGISLTYHRAISHSAIQLPIWFETIALFIAGLSLQGSVVSWAAVHKQHHARQDTEMDPHSPKILGSWFIHLFGYSFCKVETKFVGSMVRTKRYLLWHQYYYFIYLPILIGSLFLLPIPLALAIFWAPIAIVFQFENFVNTWTHSWDKDIPANKPWANLFILGEAYHLNHHNHPQDLVFHQHDVVGKIAKKIFQ